MVLWVNQATTYLKIGYQPERKNNFPEYTWGFAPLEWQNDVGAVMVVRQDKKPLLPDHVAALVEYSDTTFLPSLRPMTKARAT
jgi:hypothetical protein